MFIAIIVVLIGAIAFAFSYMSRRQYSCSACGEKFGTEYLKAERCSTCGAPVKEDFNG